MVLNDVTEFVRNGASIKQEKGCKGTPITRIETISNSRFNYDRLGYADIFDDKYQDYYLQDNDVLLSHINSEKYLGRSVVYKQRTDEVIIHGMNLLCLRFLKNRYNPSYFCYYSQSDIARMYISRNTKKSVNQASITATAIKNMPIPTTSIEEQKNVVYRLDSVQSIIDLYNEQMKKLDELIKSRFIEMFGDPVSNTKSWKTDYLIELTTKIGSGATPKGGRESYINEGISLIRSLNVYNRYFEYNSLAHITDEQAEKLDNVTIQKNDVLLNITGASVARCCVVPSDVLPARVNQHVSIIRCKPEINPVFMCNVLTEESYQMYLLELAGSGATREAITKQQIENLSIIVPPVELQNQFAEFVAQVEKQKATVQQSIDKLVTLKKSLMQDYFG